MMIDQYFDPLLGEQAKQEGMQNKSVWIIDACVPLTTSIIQNNPCSL
jgi:hypothetical protein